MEQEDGHWALGKKKKRNINAFLLKSPMSLLVKNENNIEYPQRNEGSEGNTYQYQDKKTFLLRPCRHEPVHADERQFARKPGGEKDRGRLREEYGNREKRKNKQNAHLRHHKKRGMGSCCLNGNARS